MSEHPASLVWDTEQVSLAGRGENRSIVRQEREGKKTWSVFGGDWPGEGQTLP